MSSVSAGPDAGRWGVALGVVCQVHSDFLCVPGDALVRTVAQTFRLRLARVKTCFDAALVLSALAVS